VTLLPIHAVLPDLLGALRDSAPRDRAISDGGGCEYPGAVLIAPPGAGKTTALAPALLGEPWCDGTVILLSPRRVAARAAAERMAEALGERAGGTLGYVTRLDVKRSARTRVLVMTEAIFVATILSDPELSGVSAVLFDEAHERHLDSDLGLALAIETRGVLREDLRLVVMSATIDGSRSEKPQLVAEALQRLSLTPDECWMIGDRRMDIAGARHHAMRNIGVLWGFGGAEELQLAGAQHLANTPDDLLTLLA